MFKHWIHLGMVLIMRSPQLKAKEEGSFHHGFKTNLEFKLGQQCKKKKKKKKKKKRKLQLLVCKKDKDNKKKKKKKNFKN